MPAGGDAVSRCLDSQGDALILLYVAVELQRDAWGTGLLQPCLQRLRRYRTDLQFDSCLTGLPRIQRPDGQGFSRGPVCRGEAARFDVLDLDVGGVEDAIGFELFVDGAQFRSDSVHVGRQDFGGAMAIVMQVSRARKGLAIDRPGHLDFQAVLPGHLCPRHVDAGETVDVRWRRCDCGGRAIGVAEFADGLDTVAAAAAEQAGPGFQAGTDRRFTYKLDSPEFQICSGDDLTAALAIAVKLNALRPFECVGHGVVDQLRVILVIQRFAVEPCSMAAADRYEPNDDIVHSRVDMKLEVIITRNRVDTPGNDVRFVEQVEDLDKDAVKLVCGRGIKKLTVALPGYPREQLLVSFFGKTDAVDGGCELVEFPVSLPVFFDATIGEKKNCLAGFF